MALLERIISGGQTGADIAALDFAIANGIPHGGWCPAGRKSEDGPIDRRYQLKETASSGYVQRTEWNARDSDGTVVFSIEPELSGGSKKTVFLAHKHGKPVLRISRDGGPASPEQALRRFIQENNIKALNVAGPRASTEPNVYDFVLEVLSKALAVEGSATELVTIVIGNQEEAVNEMYQAAIRLAHSGINFHFTSASYVGEFIALASKPDTRLAMFTTQGNLKQGSGDPVPTQRLDAAGIVRAIKSKRSLPVIVISTEPDDKAAVVAAGADVFLDLPAQPQHVADAVAQCLGLEPRKIVPP